MLLDHNHSVNQNEDVNLEAIMASTVMSHIGYSNDDNFSYQGSNGFVFDNQSFNLNDIGSPHYLDRTDVMFMTAHPTVGNMQEMDYHHEMKTSNTNHSCNNSDNIVNNNNILNDNNTDIASTYTSYSSGRAINYTSPSSSTYSCMLRNNLYIFWIYRQRQRDKQYHLF